MTWVFFLFIPQNFFCLKKIPPEKAGCTNQIPLTIKPYPMKIQIQDEHFF
jgi:hypothetical protein